MEDIDTILAGYQPSQAAMQVVRATPLVLLVGISGAGKDTIKKALLATGDYYDFVSFTTRQLRENHGVMEVDGVDYHYVTLQHMQELLQNGEMIEAKHYSGNVYGTGIRDLQRAQEAGKIAVNDIEVQGVAEYKAMSPEVKAVFLLPPSFDEWHKRLTARYGKDGIQPEDLALRMKTAADELRTVIEAGYYAFVVNDDIERTTEYVTKIARGYEDEGEAARGKQVAEQLLKHFASIH